MLSLMVRISAVESGYQNVKPHPTETSCYIQVVDGTNGQPLLHISTFGSESRASSPKSSQSMQFDANTASALVRAIVDAFGTAVLPSR